MISGLDTNSIAYLKELRRIAKYMVALLEKNFGQSQKITDLESTYYTTLDEHLQRLLSLYSKEFGLPLPHLPFRNLYTARKQIDLDPVLTEQDVLRDMDNFIGFIDKKLHKYEKDMGVYTLPSLSEIADYIDGSHSSSQENCQNSRIKIVETPPNTSWIDMRFQFIGPHTLHISIPGTKWAKDAMGPKDFDLEKINGRPKRPWTILHVLSKNNGRFPFDNLDDRAKEASRRQLTELSRILQEAFPKVMGGRAIQPTEGDGYECNFEIVPDQPGIESRSELYFGEEYGNNLGDDQDD